MDGTSSSPALAAEPREHIHQVTQLLNPISPALDGGLVVLHNIATYNDLITDYSESFEHLTPEETNIR